MNETPDRIFLKLFLQAAVIVMLLSVPMGWIIQRYEGRAGLSGLVTAAIICLAATVISVIPMAVAGNRRSEGRVDDQENRLAMACLLGTGIRLLLTMSAGLVVYLVLRPPMMVFSVSLVVFYLALLAWETLTAVKMIRKQYDSDNTGRSIYDQDETADARRCTPILR
ncbi:MAG: hypothetical protein JXD22_09405 [Sedimentisphaerales bacterium]|nr:hypothetical protein [Sedimentisphaerales bacterium]